MLKKSILLFIILIYFLSGLYSIDLAVTNIEGLGVDPSVPRLVEDALQSELSNYPILTLVERSRLETVLSEQNLELSGITNAQHASTLGSVLNVDKIVFGSIARYESEYVTYVLSLRLVDVERARIEVAETFKVSLKEDLLEVIARAAERLVTELEVVGRVTYTDESGVYISLGDESGLKTGDSLSVLINEKILNKQGEILLSEETPVANLSVIKLSPEGSLCRIISQTADPETGMSVRPGLVKLSASEVKTGSIRIGSIPSESNVFLNGEYVGVTPLLMENINPGSYTVEIRSGQGYKSYTGRINLRSGRTVSVERELERQLEVEDMLAFGKIPRKQTDPWTAVKKSLIPGLGAVYNGYPSSAAPQLMYTSLSLFGAFSYFTWSSSGIGEALSVPFFQFFLGAFSVGYAGSISNAWLDAKEDFLYPTYYSISTSAAYSNLRDSNDFDDGWDNYIGTDNPVTGYGIMPEFAFEGRRFLFIFSLPFLLDPMTVRMIYSQRFLIYDNWSFGAGIYLSELMQGRSPSLLYEIMTPVLSASFRSPKFEGDLFVSPLFKDDNNEWILGLIARIDLRYYWSLTSGIKLGTDIWAIEDGLGMLYYLGYTMRM